MACRISVPRPGIELTLLTLEAQSQPLDLPIHNMLYQTVPHKFTKVHK